MIRSGFLNVICLPILLIPMVSVVGWSEVANCRALTDVEQHAVTKYVRNQLRLAAPDTLVLSMMEPLSPTCFMKLTFRIEGPATISQRDYYLSPDHQYLTTNLLYLGGDEVGNRPPAMAKNDIVSGSPPILGAADAPVTIVEFADFECPFCREWAEILEHEVLPFRGDKVRILFRYMPLPAHEWALMAAQGAACAARESNDAFWTIHNDLFVDQDTTTKQNIRQRLDSYARQTRVVDMRRFQECLDGNESRDTVREDVALGFKYAVQATPTWFVNGKRYDGVVKANDIIQAIDSAASRAK